MDFEPIPTALTCFCCKSRNVFCEMFYPVTDIISVSVTPFSPLPKMINIPKNSDHEIGSFLHKVRCSDCNITTASYYTSEQAYSEWNALEIYSRNTGTLINLDPAEDKPVKYTLEEEVIPVKITQLCRECKHPMVFERIYRYDWGDVVTYIHKCSHDKSHRRQEFSKEYPCVEFRTKEESFPTST